MDETVLLIILLSSIAVLVLVTLLIIYNIIKRNKYRGHLVHFSGGADIEKGYITKDNNFFKGISGEIDNTITISKNLNSNQLKKSYNISLVNLNTNQQINSMVTSYIILGRAQNDGTIRIMGDGSISKQHCRIYIEQNSLLVEDLNSANHTYVNGMMVQSPTVVKSGDVLKLGSTKLQIYY